MRRAFLVGCPRSGTTLLQSFVALNPAIYSLPETSFFLELYGNYSEKFYGLPPKGLSGNLRSKYRRIRNWAGIANKTPTKVLSKMYRDTGKVVPAKFEQVRRWGLQEAVDAFIRILDEFAAYEGCEGWIEKTPGHFAFVDEIESRVETSHFVHLVRSPVDTIASLRDAAAKYPESEAWKPFADFEVCLSVWRRSAETALRAAKKPNHVIIEYESVVHDPQVAVRRIYQAIGLQDFELVDFEAARQRQAGRIITEQEAWKSGVLRPLNKRDKVKECLSDSEVYQIKHQLGSLWQQIEFEAR